MTSVDARSISPSVMETRGSQPPARHGAPEKGLGCEGWSQLENWRPGRQRVVHQTTSDDCARQQTRAVTGIEPA